MIETDMYTRCSKGSESFAYAHVHVIENIGENFLSFSDVYTIVLYTVTLCMDQEWECVHVLQSCITKVGQINFIAETVVINVDCNDTMQPQYWSMELSAAPAHSPINLFFIECWILNVCNQTFPSCSLFKSIAGWFILLLATFIVWLCWLWIGPNIHTPWSLFKCLVHYAHTINKSSLEHTHVPSAQDRLEMNLDHAVNVAISRGSIAPTDRSGRCVLHDF